MVSTGGKAVDAGKSTGSMNMNAVSAGTNMVNTGIGVSAALLRGIDARSLKAALLGMGYR